MEPRRTASRAFRGSRIEKDEGEPERENSFSLSEATGAPQARRTFQNSVGPPFTTPVMLRR